MTSPNGAKQTSTLAQFDPLSPSGPSLQDLKPNDSDLGSTPQVGLATSPPISFKRRAASAARDNTTTAAQRTTTGFLGNMLSSRNNQLQDSAQQDKVPDLEQPSNLASASTSRQIDPPSHITMPQSPFRHIASTARSVAIDSDEEEEAAEEDGDGGDQGSIRRRLHHNNIGTSGWTRSISRTGPASYRPHGPSFGAQSGRQAPLRNPLLMSPQDEQRLTQPSISGGRGGGGAGNDALAETTTQTTQSTPLPTIPIIVLCTAMMGEFLSASVASPFLYFMVESFGVGQGPDGGGEAAVGAWSGVVSSVFFLTQCLTSPLWVSVAERHGRRAVLCASLLGNGLTVMAFGTSKNLGTAISTRLAMGLFNGAVGVARSAVQGITDSTNESRAFTYMGLCWGLGGIVGSIIGGLTESPVKNHPYWFRDSVLFAEYPYLLPCLIAGSVTLSGGILSMFLSPDGGPRTGAIKLPSEKDVERATRTFGSFCRSIVRKLIARVKGSSPIQLGDSHNGAAASPVQLHSANGTVTPTPALSPLPTPEERVATMSSGQRRPSRFAGSAYGYSSSRRPSTAAEQAGMHIPRNRRYTGRSGYRAASVATTNAYAPDYDVDRGDFSFAQRLLLANEQAVFSLSDLWIAKEATRDEQTSQVDYEESVFEDEESRIGGGSESRAGDESYISLDGHEGEPDFRGYGTAPPSIEDLRGTARRQDADLNSGQMSPALMPPHPHQLGHGRSPSGDRNGTATGMLSPTSHRVSSYGGGGRLRRASIASSARGPSIFANTGLDEETLAASQAQAQPATSSSHAFPGGNDQPAFNPMAAIPESGRPPSVIEHEDAGSAAMLSPTDDRSMLFEEKPEPPMIRQLPLVMIAQYSLLALHGCTCDQIFMSFLVTPIPSGGLGLKAVNYAALVALMFVASMIWQFRFYPFIGPPNGTLSHLAMFRLGLFLYLPVYILFPELRGLLQEGSNGWVMFGMTLLSAIRYLANTCAYTAVMVLVNAMSPPHLVPLANGLAQSCVSAARFIGPLMGGALWAASIADGPSAHPWPFNYAAGFLAIAVLCFLGLLHSFRIH